MIFLTKLNCLPSSLTCLIQITCTLFRKLAMVYVDYNNSVYRGLNLARMQRGYGWAIKSADTAVCGWRHPTSYLTLILLSTIVVCIRTNYYSAIYM